MGGQSVLYHRHGGVTLLHITTRLVKSAAAALVRREGKTAASGSGALLMQMPKTAASSVQLEFGPLRKGSSSFNA